MLNLKALSYTSVCSALILSSLSTPVYAAPGDTFTFNNCSTTGRLGPVQAACDLAYGATTLNGLVTVTAGIQAWVVPVTATYTIQAQGAAGGTNTGVGGPFPGGLGASIQGEVALTAGETIFFIVGQMGEDTRVNTEDRAAPGGGGGSFVYRLATDPTPLIAAGAGAGGVGCSPTSGSPNANITANGSDAFGLVNGGLAGNGGTLNNTGSSYWAGGGAGWLTDGTGGNNPVANVFTAISPSGNAEGGRAPLNGALGGTRSNDGIDEGGDGGFGGGGGGGSDNMGTGGGGGYSGGGGANGNNDAACGEASIGGGGGSFNSGTNQVNVASANIGQGSIVVTQLDGGVESIPTTSFWGLTLLTALLGLFGFSKRRKK